MLDRWMVLSLGWRDLVEIALVAFIFYRALRLLSGTRAVQMLVGILFLVLAYAVAWVMKLTMITYLLGLAFTYGAFAALVVFQPELRSGLAQLGRSRVPRFLRRIQNEGAIEPLVESAWRLARRGVGAIIAVEREETLAGVLATGTSVTADVSPELLATIFAPGTPLHDGAVVVRGATIVGAGCILPLSQQPLPDKSMGTRHRAAIGLSEESDALVIVVSEESGQVSVAEHGRLTRATDAAALRALLAPRDGR
ncbi:MAG: diadenylate cyclase CdaA [Gemmatimonadaceae bacterium]|nr:diadenylate cyclase CdaA [Gemmatimonadaceae bacterium]